MFVQDFQSVAHPYREVAECLRADPGCHLRNAVRAARAADELAQQEVGFPHGLRTVSDRVQLTCEADRVHGDTLLFPIHWEATGCPSLLARVDADLEVAPFGASQSQLLIRVCGEPQTGVASSAADEQRARQLVTVVLRAFLAGLCASVDNALAEGLEPCPGCRPDRTRRSSALAAQSVVRART